MSPFSGPLAGRLAATMLFGIIALAGLAPAPCFAQASDTGTTPPATPDKKPPPAPLDPTEARIQYLHERLRITPAQEPLWAKVAQVMRDNAASVAPLIRQRLQSAEKSDAVDNLGSYERLGEAQLEGLRKFVAAFKALYAQFSNQQKKIADTLFRLAPLSMIGGIPHLAEELVAPAPYEPYSPSYAMPVPEPTAPLYQPYSYYPAYPFYAYNPFYGYYTPYGPWLWGGPPFVFAGSFLAFPHFHHRHDFHHRHAFFPHGPFVHRGFFPGRVGHPAAIAPHRH